MILKIANLNKGSGEPNRNKVGSLNRKNLEDIAKIKMEDLNANTLSQAVSMIEGTARSMGVEVKE